MQPNPVNWFEIPVNDMERAKAFYEKAFGTELELVELGPATMAWFPMEAGAAGSSGCLMQGETYVPSHDGTMVYLSVTSIEETLGAIERAGGTVLNPKTSIGEYGFVAHFEDSEGNRVALHSES